MKPVSFFFLFFLLNRSDPACGSCSLIKTKAHSFTQHNDRNRPLFVAIAGVCLLQHSYKQWLCSSLLPFFRNVPTATSVIDSPSRARVPPCRDACLDVEEKCPYFLPSVNDQYMGQPNFLCTGKYATSHHSLSSFRPSRVLRSRPFHVRAARVKSFAVFCWAQVFLGFTIQTRRVRGEGLSRE